MMSSQGKRGIKAAGPVLVIMAGGRGERFWPCSRKNRPKQLLNICGEQSLLQDTVARIAPLTAKNRILVVANQDYELEVRRQLPQLKPENILVEPESCNTAIAIGLALAYIRKRFQTEDPQVIFLPCDSLVYEPQEVCPLLEAGLRLSRDLNRMMIVGITPTRAEIGYGYIQLGAELNKNEGFSVYQVAGFKEKPDQQRAEAYLCSGEYLWNGGVVLGRAKLIGKEIQEHLPELAMALEEVQESLDTITEAKMIRTLYATAPKISFDHAVLEKSGNLGVIKAQSGWDDLGNWGALERWLPRDEAGNVSHGEFIGLETNNCNVFSPQKIVTTLGVSNLIIVESDDVLLVCAKERAQEIKVILDELRSRGRDSLL